MSDPTERALRDPDRLANSERRLRAAVMGSLDGVYLLEASRDADGVAVDFVFQDVNQRGADLVRLPAAEIVGRRLCELFPVNRTGGFFDRYLRVMETGVPLEEEFALTLDDGRTIWLHHQVVPTEDGVAISTREVTERVRMTESLRLYQQALDGANEGILITGSAAEDFPILYANPAFEQLTGYSTEEVIGRNCRFLQGPDTDPAALDRILQSIHRGEPLVETLLNYRKDGTPFWNRLSLSPIGTASGTVDRYVGVLEDLSERRRIEEQLARSERHYRLLFERAPYGIYALDPDGRFTQLNRAGEAILGRRADELLGEHFGTVVAEEDLKTAEETFRSVDGHVRDTEAEICVVRPGGERRLLTLSVTPFGEGRTGGVYGIARDVTDERRREQHLRRVERLASIGTLIAGVAHELNNPLTAVTNFARLLLEDARSDEDREALEIIVREADRMAKIVADLRSVARETQETSKEHAPVDLNEVAAHSLRVRGYSLRTHGIEVREDLAPGLPLVVGDRGELEQVVLNLIVNAEQALAHHPGERRLILRTRASDRGADLDVVDSGPGIPPAHLARIFDPFYTTKPPGEGTGLGLSLVHSIVAEHGGEIHASSEPGRGAAFHLTLPAARRGARAAASAPPRSHPATRSLRVLVIDDELPVRLSVARFLRRRGHTVDMAEDGRQALELVERTAPAPYDVILSDFRMPGIGGEELLEELRRRGGNREQRLILMTGDAASADTARLLSGGTIRAILKPFDFRDLAAMVEGEPAPGSPPEPHDV